MVAPSDLLSEPGDSDDVRHPHWSKQFVLLPATGAYMPTADFAAAHIEVDGDDSYFDVINHEGLVVAHVEVSGSTDDWLGKNVTVSPVGDGGRTFCELMEERYSEIAAAPPNLATETACVVLAAESLLSEWCSTQAGLVWCDYAGAHTGRWMAEPFPADAATIGLLARAVPAAALVWADGTRIAVRRGDTELKNLDRVAVLPTAEGGSNVRQ